METKNKFNWHKLFRIIEILCYGLLWGAIVQADLDGATLNFTYGIVVTSILTVDIIVDQLMQSKAEKANK